MTLGAGTTSIECRFVDSDSSGTITSGDTAGNKGGIKGSGVFVFDRNGRVIDYSFDSLSRQTAEKWYDNLTDADVPQNVRKTYTTTYDEASRVASIGDGDGDFDGDFDFDFDFDFDYTYSILGNLTNKKAGGRRLSAGGTRRKSAFAGR